MNFFNTACQKGGITESLFGLCDDQAGGPAYVDFANNNDNWVATVINNSGLTLVFTAIDKCVLNDNDEKGRGRCDAMLTSSEHLYFVELKSAKKSTISHGKAQLASTIQFFLKHHLPAYSNYRHRKAFLCNNRKNSRFIVIDNEEQKRFYREHGFRLDIQNQVLVF